MFLKSRTAGGSIGPLVVLCALLLAACGSSSNPASPPTIGPDKRGTWTVGSPDPGAISCSDATPTTWTATLTGTSLLIPFQLGTRVTVTPSLTLHLDDGGSTTEDLPLPATTVATAAALTVTAAFPVTSTALGALDVVLTLADSGLTAEISGGNCSGTLGRALTPPASFANTNPSVGVTQIVTTGSAVTGNFLDSILIDPDGGPVPVFTVTQAPTFVGLLTANTTTGDFTYDPQGSVVNTMVTVMFDDGYGFAGANVSVINDGSSTPPPDPRGSTGVNPTPTGGTIDCGGWAASIVSGSTISIPKQWGSDVEVTSDLTLQLDNGVDPVEAQLLNATVAGTQDPATGIVTATFPLTGITAASAANISVDGTVLTLTLTDTGGLACTGSQTYTVTPPVYSNVAPTALAGATINVWGLPKTGNLLGLAIADPDGGPAPVFSVVTAPAQGTLTLDTTSGAFVYTPSAGAANDSFRVRFDDGNAFVESDVAVVNNGPGSGNQPPVAGDFHYAVDYAGASARPLPASDPNGDPLTFNLTVPPVSGATVTYDDVTKNFTYTAAFGSTPSDTDSFAFTVTDINGATSAEATVTLRLSWPDARGTYTLGAGTSTMSCDNTVNVYAIDIASGTFTYSYQLNDLGVMSGDLTVTGTLSGNTSGIPDATWQVTSVDTVDYAATTSQFGDVSASFVPLNILELAYPSLDVSVGTPNTSTLIFLNNLSTTGEVCSGNAFYTTSAFVPLVNTAPQAGGLLTFDSTVPPLSLDAFINDPDGGAGQYYEIKADDLALGSVTFLNQVTGQFTYTATATGTDSFTFFHHDGTDGVTVTVTVINP